MDIGAVIDGSSIAITGGTGTLGQAIVRELTRYYHPSKIVIISRSESRQASMKQNYPEDGGPMRYRIGDVRDLRRMNEALADCKLVIHAAALKRVETCEAEPEEALMTNVIGTLNVIKAARNAGAERFMFVSSDKATAPIMTYGATKYMAERLTVGMNAHRQGTSLKLSCVRYGNVLGSTGSVIHQFRSGDDGPIPITDKRMTRFWWTPRDAARFVLSSLSIMRGGEIFIPKIPAMHITDMAEAIAPNRPQEIIGLRGPEKIHESMISPDESRLALELRDSYVLMPALSFWPGASWPEAMPLPENWAYTSAWAAQRDPLTKERLLEMLEDV